ncbi:MAG: glycosyltransferase [Clostridia bacterium]|nr:glycosyltransferase [Clostridia bacterium]
MNDRISVVIPVFNAEKYLAKCVESIEKQTYKYFSIVLVDDGSSDGSGKLCDELKAKYNNISVIHQKNSGASSARNAGIEASDGEYIVFCDSDDYIDSEMFQKLINAQIMYSDRLALCGIKKLTSSGEKSCVLDGDNLLTIDKEDFFIIQKTQLFNAPVNKLFRRDVLITKGIRFNPSIALGEDLIFNADYVMATGCDFAVVNEPLYIYDTSVTNSVSKKYLPQMLSDYIELKHKFDQLIEYTKADMDKYASRYATILLYNIVNAIKNAMSEKNDAPSSQKIKQIKEILDSFDVKAIVSKADTSAYSDIYLKMLCSGNARLVYTFRTIRK